MLIILATLVVWIPAVFGYGILQSRIQKTQDRPEFLFEAISGMFLLSVVTNIIHFFHAIDLKVSIALALAGWILCVLRFLKSKPKFSMSSICFLLIWVIFLSFWSTQIPRNPDAALYHLQAIKWTNQNQLTIGLANLHDRLGFNSSWFSFAALLQVPFLINEGANALSVSALLTFFFGIAVFQSIQKMVATKRLSAENLFLVVAALLVLSDVTRRNISSPSPDYAVMVLCICITYLALPLILRFEDATFRLFQILAFTIFAVTIKLTAFPLCLLAGSLIAFAIKANLRVDWKKLGQHTAVFAGLPMIVFLIRGILLSGYLNYPSVATIIPGLTWTVPRAIADHQWFANQGTSRLTYPDQHPFSEWIGPWLINLVQSSDFLLFCFFVLTGALLIFSNPGIYNRRLNWIVLPLIAAIACWFLIGPAMRFGAGYFWSLGLLLLSTGLTGLAPKAAIRTIAVVVVLALVSFLPRMNVLNAGLPPLRKAVRAPERFLLELPIPKARTRPVDTANGIRVHIPADGTFNCWLSELPCSPWISKNLVALKTPDGGFKMFYHAETSP